MTTDPLDGLEQLRRIIDEQPEPAPESVMLGLDYCYAEWVAERARHAEEVAELEKRVAYVHGILMNTARERNVAQEEITGDATVEASKTPKGNPTPTEPDAPMYVPPDSAPVLQSLIEESAKLGHWALHEQLRAVLASVEGERARHAEEVARLRDVHLDETPALDDLRLKEIASLRDQLRRTEGARDEAQRQCGELHEHLARAWEEGAEAAFDAEDPGPDSDYIRPLFGRALDEFYASNPYRTKGCG